MSDGYKVRNWAYLLLRGQETIAEREGVKGTLRGAGETIAEREGDKGTLRGAGEVRRPSQSVKVLKEHFVERVNINSLNK